MNSSVLACRSLSKSFHEVEKDLVVLREVNFSVQPNESVAILGASGSGKSTFLHLLGGLDKPSAGEVFWNDKNIQKLSEKEKCIFRNKHLGFVYQFHHLLPEFTALENVAMPLLLSKASSRSAREAAQAFLGKVDLSDRMHHKIGELSGGERQRTAVARALVTQPRCVLADEPTGNLDHQTAASVFQVMLDLQKAK